MTIAAARSELAAVLKPALKKFDVFPSAGQVGNSINKPTLVLQRTRLQPSAAAPLSAFTNTLDLWVIEPTTYPGRSEDSLDALLEQVVEALDYVANTAWDSADRDTWEGTNPAYRITLTATSTRNEN